MTMPSNIQIDRNIEIENTWIEGYQAAKTGAALVDHTGYFGRFELTDRDRLDLLHRMSTGDLNRLKPGEGTATVLTTALARIIDQVVVYNRGEVAFAVSGPGRVGSVRGWLQKHIFFNDKVKTRDVSAETAHFGLYGAQTNQIADRIVPGASALPIHHFREGTCGGVAVTVARTFKISGAGFWVFGKDSDRIALSDALCNLPGVSLADATAYDALRIESGVPEAGHELTEDYIPLEAGLWSAVSFAKGCYIGQEIIARMESRNKLARTLIAFTVPGGLTAGAAIHTSEKAVGSVTSAAALPDGSGVGIGYIRTEAISKPLNIEGQAVTVTYIPESARA